MHEVLAGHAEGYVPGGLPEPTESVSSQGDQHGKGDGCTIDNEDAAEVKATVSAIKPVKIC